jgi:hypothetical protein
VADQNWQTFNNFRSGDMTAGDGTSAPDLTLAMADICEIDCDEDRLILWLHAGNEGAVDLDIESELLVYARTGGTDTLLDAMVVDPTLYTGAYADSIQVELTMSDVGAADSIVFVISSQELECDETNNELVWDGPFCD